MQKPLILLATLGITFALGCRRSDDLAPRDLPEPPPTEAEAVPAIRALMESAERGGVHMRFWRLGAGTPGPDGWMTATPTRGGFEIDLPIQFNDFSQTTKATDGAPIEISSIGGPWEGGKLSCTRTRRLDGSPTPTPAKSLLEEWKSKPDTLSAHDRTWEGFPAADVETRTADAHGQILIVDAGSGGIFMVIADLPEAAWTTHQAEVDRFMHSLRTKLAPPGGR